MSNLDHTHDPQASSWVPGADTHPDFPVQNLPLGVFSPAGKEPRGGVAIGNYILDLTSAASLLDSGVAHVARAAAAPTLNALLGLGNEVLRELRQAIFALLIDPGREVAVLPMLHDAADCRLHLPVAVGDYTDFYAGIRHAENVGRLFRPDNPLLPNYKYVPIGYHGRASSIRPSGVDVVRPHGQTKAPEAEKPDFGPVRRLDYEFEMAIWIGEGNELGRPIPITDARRHIVGLSILNDWSARDIQTWEAQPLGPFLAKSFHTTVSPWIVTADALEPFRTAQPPRAQGDPEPLSYLYDAADQATGALDIKLELFLQSEAMRRTGVAPHRISRGSMRAMYWTPAQLVAHHTSNGCNLSPGDLLGTGTLSGEGNESVGSLLELTEGGKRPIDLPGGETRTFLEDGDEVIMKAFAERQGYARIGFGECRARVIG